VKYRPTLYLFGLCAVIVVIVVPHWLLTSFNISEPYDKLQDKNGV